MKLKLTKVFKRHKIRQYCLRPSIIINKQNCEQFVKRYSFNLAIGLESLPHKRSDKTAKPASCR